MHKLINERLRSSIAKKVKTMPAHNNDEDLLDFLCERTKKGHWEAVVKMYAKDPKAQCLKLNRFGDTALHLAVVDNQEEVVVRLVEIICKSTDYKNVLENTNERGNNLLHLAVGNGSFRICHAILSAHEQLVDMRNKEGYTPLFLAAAYGHKNVFYCIYNFCRNDISRITSNCRMNNTGDTVLHCALRNEQFDLAFQLIQMNKEAVHWVDAQGVTPLHVLASKPSCFKSGANIWGWWRIIVYHLIPVNQQKPRSLEILIEESLNYWLKAKKTSSPSLDNYDSAPPFPDNYETCIEFFMRLCFPFLKAADVLYGLFKKKKNVDQANKDKDLEKCVHEEIQNSDTEESEIVYTEKSESFDTEESENIDTEKYYQHVNIGLLPTSEYPGNYNTCINFLQIFLMGILIILGHGSTEIRKIWKKKEKHTWSVQVMEIIFGFHLPHQHHGDGRIPTDSKFQEKQRAEMTRPYYLKDDEVYFSPDEVLSRNGIDKNLGSEKPNNVKGTEDVILLAATNGVIEIVMKILEGFNPHSKLRKEEYSATYNTVNSEKKNIVLLAAEHRQSNVYMYLVNKKYYIENLFRAVDINGNSALHLAASSSAPKLWNINGDALELQWEVEWFKLVKKSMPLHFFASHNKKGKTASTMFKETHMDLMQKGKDWLYNTSQSCSVVATLIATVAFATAATIPGGNDDHGVAILRKEQSFFIFTISSLIALSLSTTSVIIFLSILTARFDIQEYFDSIFPWKLLVGLSSLYFSIIAMLISFCTGHYVLLNHHLQNKAVMIYTLTFLPIAFIFSIMHLPLYFDLLLILLQKVPRRSIALDD